MRTGLVLRVALLSVLYGSCAMFCQLRKVLNVQKPAVHVRENVPAAMYSALFATLVAWASVLWARHYRQHILQESVRLRRDCAIDGAVLLLTLGYGILAVLVFRSVPSPDELPLAIFFSALAVCCISEEIIRYVSSVIYRKFVFHLDNFNVSVSDKTIRWARAMWIIALVASATCVCAWAAVYFYCAYTMAYECSQKLWATSAAIFFYLFIVLFRAAT